MGKNQGYSENNMNMFGRFSTCYQKPDTSDIKGEG